MFAHDARTHQLTSRPHMNPYLLPCRYVGWLLYDRAGAVRSTTLTCLVGIYSMKASQATTLSNFTTRFEASCPHAQYVRM